MKKTLLALALVAASSAFASGPSTSFTGVASATGAINNSISSVASAGSGGGTSFSYAASGASSVASASVLGSASALTNGVPCNPTVIGGIATGSIKGATATDVWGVAFNSSTGDATGSASAAGWSDAAASASFSAHAPGGAIATSGSIDTGSVNHAFGPDINVSAGRNQAIGAEGQAGGQFASTVALSTSFNNGAVSGSVTDLKSTSNYANTFRLSAADLGAAWNISNGNINVLDASSTSIVNASGNFNVSSALTNVH